ncbi:MAG: hypothetical protein HW403_890 [Dehalococcoidia bacterium]|nr:hypothetical protein [Dehalococcoidia bacterium]
MLSPERAAASLSEINHSSSNGPFELYVSGNYTVKWAKLGLKL